jgi:lipopolysaccharide/colanic/teichoic acid biosynthesis glycosyltransferase
MSRRGQYLLFTALVIADALAVAAGLLVALSFFAPFANDIGKYITAIQLSIIGYLLIFATLRLYDLETVLEDSQEYATVATGCTYGILGLVVVNALVGRSDLEPIWLLAGWAATVFTVGAGRFGMRRVVRFFRGQGHLITRTIIVGADEQGRTIARQFKSLQDSGVNVVGFVDDFLPAGTPVQDGLTVLGHPSRLTDIVREHRAAEVVVVPGALAWETFHEIIERSALGEDFKIRLSPGYYDLLAATPRVAHRNFVPLIVVDRARLNGFDLMMKMVLDYGLGTLLLVASLPVTAFVALWLKRVNNGKVLQTQSVVGQGGRHFNAIYFRLESDKPLAGLMRNMGVPLLPSLFLVPLGLMSLIGPRPIPEDKRTTYQRWLPTIASVRPGVSGPWAVAPMTSLEEEMRATIFYVRNWTIWLDLQMIAQTGLVILRTRWERLSE